MFKNRGYKREAPQELVKDYKLFAIACEGGKREPQYFNLFKSLSPKVAVDVIDELVSDEEMEAKNGVKSAPKWVLDRAMRYIEKEGLSPEDELWFVLDKDRWSDKQLREIQEYCEQQPNWNVAISNPCFEVWLYFHIKSDISTSESTTCNDFKAELHQLIEGGYNPIRFIEHVKQAIANASASDSNPQHFMPAFKETKLYALASGVMQFVGQNGFDKFLAEKLPLMIKMEEARIRASIARKK